MNKRELYKQKASAQLDEWSASLDVLKARAEKLTAQAKIDMQPRLDAVHEKFASAKTKLDKLEATTDEKWDEFVADVDSAWKDFKASLEGTFDAIKSHT